MEQNKSAEWLSPADAAARLGVTAKWVRMLAQAGRLRGVQTPNGWLIDAADVERRSAALRELNAS